VRQIRDVLLVEISSDDTARTITGQLRPIVSKFAYAERIVTLRQAIFPRASAGRRNSQSPDMSPERGPTVMAAPKGTLNEYYQLL
jgi:hypothetical protein